jgi:MATE family multidrug resistance protein
MTQRSPIEGSAGEVLGLSYPVVLSMLAQTTMGLVDTLFMGWVSTEAQAGLGLGNMLAWAACCFFVGAITVVNTAVAQRYGAGDERGCGVLAYQGMIFAAGATLLLLGLGMHLVPPLAGALGAPAGVAAIAERYATIRIVGMALFLFETALTSFMRGIGDTRTPMKVALGTMALNVPLNYWLIFGGLGVPPLGPEGAAWATALATLAGLVVLALLFARRSWRERYGTGLPARLPWRGLGELAQIGLPIGAHWLLETVGWTVFTMAVARFGAAPMAAHNIVLQVLHVSFMPGLALSIAATTLVGQALGARRPELARRSAHLSLAMAAAFMAAMGLLFWFGGELITGWFNQDPEVRRLGAQLFVVAACFQIFDAAAMVSGGVLRGAALTRFPLVVTVACVALFLGPGFWLFGVYYDGGVVGAWGGATAYISVAGVIMLVAVLRGRWLTQAKLLDVSDQDQDDAQSPPSPEGLAPADASSRLS